MATLQRITPEFDPWEAYLDMKQYGKPTLTNVEFTTTTFVICDVSTAQLDIRCSQKTQIALPLDLILKRLDEIPIFEL